LTNKLERLRIAFLAGTLGQGGAERQLYYILQTLCAIGAEVEVLCLTKGEFWERPILDLGVPIIWVGAKQSRSARLAAIISQLRKSRSRIIQSHHFYTNPYAALAGRALRIRDIGAIRNNAIYEVEANGRIFGPACLRLPRHLAANSLVGKRNAERLGVPGSRISFLPNVVDANYFLPVCRHDDSKISILNIGRMDSQKNQRLFLSVLARLRKQSPVPVVGLLAGDGPDRGSLECLAREHGLLPGSVEFLGNVNDPLSLYQAADIFLLTSDWEGTPNVVMEAMACGVPVVATAVGGVPDLIENNRNGLLASKGDLGGLVCLLQDLITDHDKRKRLGEMARRSSLEKHDLQRLPEILDQFYHVVL
jgi:glycosyltransferase involved in cell wall biosynthesis